MNLGSCTCAARWQKLLSAPSEVLNCCVSALAMLQLPGHHPPMHIKAAYVVRELFALSSPLSLCPNLEVHTAVPAFVLHWQGQDEAPPPSFDTPGGV